MTDSFNDLIICILTVVLIYIFYKKMCKKNLPSVSSSNVDVNSPKQLLDINSNTVNNNQVVSNMMQNELQHTQTNMPYVMDDNSLDINEYHEVAAPTTIMHNEQPVDKELIKEPSNFNYTKLFSNDFDYYTPEQLYPAFE